EAMLESPLLPEVNGSINGEWRDAATGAVLPVRDPANGELLAEVPDMGAAETTEAVEAAQAALDNGVPPDLATRSAWLATIADQLLANQDEFARIITLEQGKPLKEAAAEVAYAAGFFQFFSGQLKQLESDALPEPIKNLRWAIHHRPAGVAALITPWNFPLAMLAKKLAPALAAGCTVVIKPAELTPLSAIALCHLAERAGVPPGRVNLVIGQPIPIGAVLCSHPAIRVLSFTGSTEVGKLLLRDTAPHIKRLALELGGNAPFTVFEDAHIEAAADALLLNKFRCAGQTCVCANRIYVQRKIADEFVTAVVARVSSLRVGHGLTEGTDIGPLINRDGFDKVASHVADALVQGAQRVCGEEPPRPQQEWGAFYPPAVLTGVGPQMLVTQEETFGPIVAVATFTTEDEAVAQANSTPSGLAAYCFTGDAARAECVAARLKFGHVGLNTGQGPTPEAPFGGMKQSGFGREGGIEGLWEYCETQTVVRS
ncbi:MAG TPA: NAD-dependent succinate-semialdehyde dehydrogenase, partial [Abditibacteriaceae bacterium]|nr:NAD-dependent succinate-semialdehyde dehydrogenase [Abditibacteriaceae bacterium]